MFFSLILFFTLFRTRFILRSSLQPSAPLSVKQCNARNSAVIRGSARTCMVMIRVMTVEEILIQIQILIENKKIQGGPGFFVCNAALSKVFYLVLTCSNQKVFSSSTMCTYLQQKSELNSHIYYSVLTHSNPFIQNANSKIHISNPYIYLLDIRI